MTGTAAAAAAATAAACVPVLGIQSQSDDCRPGGERWKAMQ